MTDQPSATAEAKADALLDELDVDGNMGYGYGSTGSLVTRLVWNIEQLETQLAEARSALQACKQLVNQWKQIVAEEDNDDFGRERVSVRSDDIEELEAVLAAPSPARPQDEYERLRQFAQRIADVPVDTSPHAVESGLTVAYWRDAAREALKAQKNI